MIMVRGTTYPPFTCCNFGYRSWQIIDPPMKIIGGTEENYRTGYLFQAWWITDLSQIQLIGRIPIAYAAT